MLLPLHSGTQFFFFLTTFFPPASAHPSSLSPSALGDSNNRPRLRRSTTPRHALNRPKSVTWFRVQRPRQNRALVFARADSTIGIVSPSPQGCRRVSSAEIEN